MQSQGYKGSRGSQRKTATGVGEKLYRTEWRVVSQNRSPRMEIFDISFSRDQSVHEHMSKKLEFALKQLQNNVLRFGENAEFSSAYFVGKN